MNGVIFSLKRNTANTTDSTSTPPFSTVYSTGTLTSCITYIRRFSAAAAETQHKSMQSAELFVWRNAARLLRPRFESSITKPRSAVKRKVTMIISSRCVLPMASCCAFRSAPYRPLNRNRRVQNSGNRRLAAVFAFFSFLPPTMPSRFRNRNAASITATPAYCSAFSGTWYTITDWKSGIRMPPASRHRFATA